MKVLIANPNFLILDEPTNDLDIDTLNVLEDFLENFKGVLLLVSHDRYLIDKLTEQLFILEGDGEVRVFNGNYTEYRLEKDDKQQVKQTTVDKKTETPPPAVKKNKLSYKEQKELESLEGDIRSLEIKIESLTTKLNSDLTDHTELIKIAEEIEKTKQELDELTFRWLELMELKESII